MKRYSTILLLTFIAILFMGVATDLSAQSRYFGNKYKITAEFDTTKLIIKKGEVISKILKIVNSGENALNFSLDLTHPNEWQSLTPRSKAYNLPAGDSIFVPVRIIPMGKIMGNTSYLIYAYIINGDDMPVASSYFLASRNKVVNWELNVDPGEKLYFKNGQREIRFSVNLMNVGNEETDIILDIQNRRKDRLLLTDTNDRIIKEPTTISLPALEDQSLYYKVKSVNSIRNYKRVDLENFQANQGMEYQKYSLFATSRESALTGKGEMIKAKKIDFITLPNSMRANRYRRSSVPLIFDANLSNFAGSGQPILQVGLRGNTVLKNNDFLIYSSFNNFSSYIGSPLFLTNGSYYLGYFNNKFNVSASSGPGAKYFNGYYRIDKRQSIYATYLRSPRYYGQADRTNFMLNYNNNGQKFSHSGQVGRFTYRAAGITTNSARYTVAYPILEGHRVGLSAGLANNISSDPNNKFDRTGFFVGLNYGGRYLNNDLTSSLTATLYSKDYSIFGNGNSLGLNHMSRYKISDTWNVTLSNRYVDNRNIPQTFLFPNYKYVFFSNQATFGRRVGNHAVTSELFYNVSNIDTILNHSRGLGVGISKFDIENNRLISLRLRGGYNRIINDPNPQDIFFAQFFALYKYRVWSVNVRYNYGMTAPTRLDLFNGVFPQTVGVSVGNQHQFANPHFVLDNIVTYSYYNIFDRQSLGYTPDFYYFTNSGWRIRLTSGFYFSSSSGENRFFATSTAGGEDGEPKRNVSTSFYLNLGVRKEFGIPIPWAKTVFPRVTFMAFLDHDGDGLKDDDEIPLENVVVRFGEWELLTDLFGGAVVENIKPDSSYSFSVFSLVDLQGYFPKIESKFLVVDDSVMMIPFVKGIKVYGNVYVDREKMAPGATDKLDLSRIMIYAVDHGLEPNNTLTNSDGSFQFYLPYGQYTVSVDDRILGNNFRILQNDVKVNLDEMSDGMFISFYIVERRRKVNIKKFNGNGEVINGTERTVQPEEPSGGNGPGRDGNQGGGPGGTGQPDGGSPPDGDAPPSGAGNTDPDGSSDNTTGSGENNTGNVGTGAAPGGTDISLRDPMENISLQLEDKSITWAETEYYIILSAFNDDTAAKEYIETLEKQDNALIIRSLDNLQYLAIYAYRTEAEAIPDLKERKAIAPAAWITKKEE